MQSEEIALSEPNWPVGHVGFEPYIATPDAACADLKLPFDLQIYGNVYSTVPLLIAFDIPIDWCLYLQPRSSLFTKYGLLSTTGIVDSDYKGTVHAQLYNMSQMPVTLRRGQRIVQVQLFQKQRIQFEKVELIRENDLRPTGIGSTGDF
jgi:dUTP pyrophosphatase